MDSDGGFHEVEKNGKLFLVYHHPKYCPISQIHTPTSSAELSLQPLFLCPTKRQQKDVSYANDSIYLLSSSPEYVIPTTTDSSDHHVLPLFWCNNKEFDTNGGCDICNGSNFGTDYYFCNYCDKKFHRECIQSPLKINHPYHPQHPLQLSTRYYMTFDNIECLCCRILANGLMYHCTICHISMHPTCAMKPITFVVDPQKNHIHPLMFFPRQTCLTCNLCGWLRQVCPTNICVRCNFVSHADCMNLPHIIKISRHHHRISFTLSFPSRSERFCGVCRQSINGDYGAYTCDKCSDYVVHPICATWKNVWDGKELEGVPEEDDITQDVGPFEMISEGVILYFLHDHHLRLEVNILYDENKFCQACVLPIYEGDLYSCMECEFILHETCAKAPRRIQHALHLHPLKMKQFHNRDFPECDACGRTYNGFGYGCNYKGGNCFNLDVRCASISEPFDYKGHEHRPLFISLNQGVERMCDVCKRRCLKQLNCMKCNFIVCFRCVTLPYKAKYQHYDTHSLTLLWGDEVSEKYWCEVCERNLQDTGAKVFYGCNECYTCFHVECVIGADPYLKPYNYVGGGSENDVQTLPKRKISRPLCVYCKNRCQGKIFKMDHHNMFYRIYL